MGIVLTALGNKLGWGKRRKNTLCADLDYAELQEGDVIVTRGASKLINTIIPGHYTHCLIYVGNGKCIHAIPPEVRVQSAADIPYYAKEWKVIRHHSRLVAIMAAKSASPYIGRKYDYEFIRARSHKNLYCTELVAACYNLRFALGTGIILPDELLTIDAFHEVGASR